MTAPSAGQNYFWVGGDGSWHESTNWSLSSGGAPLSTSCLPSLNDNVMFDNNSFTSDNQKVEIENDKIAYAKTLFWNADQHSNIGINFPTTVQLNPSMYIFGDIVLEPNMIINAHESVEINIISPDMELDTKNVFMPTISTKNSNPVISLLSVLNCERFRFKIGQLFTNNYDIITIQFCVEPFTADALLLDFGTSTVTVDGPFDLDP